MTAQVVEAGAPALDAWERRRPAVAPMPPPLGRLAGTQVPHLFEAIAPVMGAPQCRECFGWYDDHRHYGGRRG